PATYSILQGPTGVPSSSYIPPTLTDPDTQVVLGYILINPETDVVSGEVRYIPTNSPDTGDQADAKLHIANTFSALQQLRHSANLIVSQGGVLNLPNNVGNSFTIRGPVKGIKLIDVPPQAGTEIWLHIPGSNSGSGAKIYSSSYEPQDETGIRPIHIPGLWANGSMVDSNGYTRNTLEYLPDNTETDWKYLQVGLRLVHGAWQVFYVSRVQFQS